MKNICQDGWQDRECPLGVVAMQHIPQTSDGSLQWAKVHSNMFRGEFLQRLIELRNDFAQLNYKDHELDESITREIQTIQASDKAKAEAAAKGHPVNVTFLWDILPQEMEHIAQRLRALAGQLK
jgi:hypothetical protein